MRRLPRVCTALLLALLLALPAASQLAAQGASLPASVLDPTWNLTAINGEAVAPLGERPLTLKFNPDGTLGGSGGCNGFGGGYTLGSDNALSVGSLVITQIFCEGGVSELEQRYLGALQRTASYSQAQPGQLALALADGGSLAFVAAAVAPVQPVLPPGVLDPTWNLTQIVIGRMAPIDTTGKGISIDFGPDGGVGGSGGCNTYGGSYSVGADRALTLSQLIKTLIACEGEVGALEDRYLGALQNTSAYTLEDASTLVLATNNGGSLRYTAAPSEATPAPGPATPTPAAQQCFSETGKCVAGRFLEFWNQHGGLPVFGLPLSDQLTEDGRQVQYFERQRFELHPENSAPYDVLLGRLGDDLLRRQGVDWSTWPKATTPVPSGCVLFAETGHSVCNQPNGPSFLSYWQSNGLEFDGRAGKSYVESLALFGLPLSEPIEVEIEGQRILAQWFERARFEWHPSNPAASRVLLGRLGAEWLAPPAPPAPPAPEPAAITQDDNGEEVALTPGQSLIVTLASNSSTGYTWQVAEIDSAVLRQEGEPEYRNPPEPMPGAPGEQVFRFTAVASGTTTLTIIYLRPFEPVDTPPVETFSVTVTVR